MRCIIAMFDVREFAALNLVAVDVPPELIETAWHCSEIPLVGDFKLDPKTSTFVAVEYGLRWGLGSMEPHGDVVGGFHRKVTAESIFSHGIG